MGKKLGRLLRILAWLAPVYQLRSVLVRGCGVKVGSGVYIGNLVFFDGEYPEYIEIEDEVSIGPGAIIVSHAGASPFLSRQGIYYKAPERVTLKRGCWIGAGAIILPGVTVGMGAIVTAGSVVNQDVPPYMMVAGHPGRVVKKLDQPSGKVEAARP